MIIQKIARRVGCYCQNKEETDEVTFDPATILLLMSVLIEVIKLIKECKEAKDVNLTASLPTSREYKMVSRTIRRKIGWRRWFKDGKKITDSVFKAGITSTQKEIEEAYKEVE